MLVDLFSSVLCYLSVNWVFNLVYSMEVSTGHTEDTATDRQSPAARNTIPNARQSPTARSEAWQQLGSPRYVLAPMVDASELPWRLLSRRYGAQLCYTPMVAGHQFIIDRKLRKEILESTPQDRPLIVQFCGNDAKNLTEAAILAAPHCDGIDINLGCPQMVAKRGHYGAYLQDDWPLLTELVTALRAAVKVPISCKIRIHESVERTVEYARMLEKAGCQILTVHGRTVHQRGDNTGLASWEHITAVVKSVGIPVIANGNIQCLADVHKCLNETGAAAVMTAEGNMYNPALFTTQIKPNWELAEEYLDLATKHPVKLLYARGHVFNLCHHLLVLPENHDVRFLVGKTNAFEDLRKAVAILKERYIKYHEGKEVWIPNNYTKSYNLKLPPWICQPYVRPTLEEKEFRKNSISEEEKLRGYSVARLKKKRKQEAIANAYKRKKIDMCTYTRRKCNNPRGQSCSYLLCRTCCKDYCVSDHKDCRSHRHFSSKALRVEFESEMKSKNGTSRVKRDSEIETKQNLNGDADLTNGLNTDELSVDCKRVILDAVENPTHSNSNGLSENLG